MFFPSPQNLLYKVVLKEFEMNCPTHGIELVSKLTILEAPWIGQLESHHGYCPECERWVPNLPGKWSPYDADWGKSIKKETETVRDRRQRMLGRSPWG